MYKVVTRLFGNLHWMPLNQIDLIAYEASSMMGHHTRLVARLYVKVPTLINVRCIAHHEALAAGGALRVF